MLDAIEPNRSVKAFDSELIHDGNRGLGLDVPVIVAAVDALLAEMTLEQMVHELHGWQTAPIEGLYFAGGDEALNLPPFKMVDGPRGARSGLATAFPVAIARGATFDAELERRVGLAAGLEVAAKGGNVILAPTINLLRHPGWGRAQETYSEDPHHMGAMGVAFVSGAQNHVLTSPKHFALNNLEMTRFELSANVDERTLHEVYLPHFKRCVVEGGAGSIMSAYNKVNGVYCGEHPELLNKILREDWGYQSFVESDWFLGTRSTAPAINAGMDIEMPAAFRFTSEKIKEGLDSGALEPSVVRRNAGRALFAKLAFRLDEMILPDASVVECEAHVSLAREVAEKSFVLLENNGVLPLNPKQTIAVVGELADTENLGDRGSSMVKSSEVTTPLAGLLGYSDDVDVTYLNPLQDDQQLDGFDVVLVVAGLTYVEEGEFIPTQQQESEGGDLARGGDRADLRLPEDQVELIRRVASLSKKTVVLLEGGSAIEVADWVDIVDALMMIWYPGREGGHALARVLFGEVNPSGCLPLSFPRDVKQLMDWDIAALDVPHDLYHGYRYLDQQGEDPQYPFGFGLSYTQFSLDGVSVERAEDRFFFNVTVTNTGARQGGVVPQLYVSTRGSLVDRVKRELKGFGRVELKAGESADLEIEIEDEALCYYSPGQGWVLEPCTYDFVIGFSALDQQLLSTWHLNGLGWEPQ